MSPDGPRPPSGAHRLALTDTSLQFAAVGLSLALLTVCLLVRPDPQGIGTHSRLGLPRCGYLARHGVPCPSCGATTGASWFVRGRPLMAWRTHPAGFAAGCAVALLIPFSLISMALGRPWMVHLRRVSLPAWTALVCVFLGLFLIGWPKRVKRYRNAQRSAHITESARPTALRADDTP